MQGGRKAEAVVGIIDGARNRCTSKKNGKIKNIQNENMRKTKKKRDKIKNR